MNTFKQIYNEKIKNIDEYIKECLDSIKTADDDLYQSLYYAVLNGGKRLRSILCCEIACTLGAKMQDALPFAAAIEFIHAYSLVHDDLPGMDNSYERRGMPSCHVKYGVGPAILTGDTLLNFAYETMTKECINKNGAVSQLRAMQVIGDCAGIHGMINGQATDLKIAAKLIENVDECILIKLIEQKTMALIRAAVLSGAYVAKCGDNVLQKLDKFAYCIGLAFQIRDDFEDEEQDNDLTPNFINILGRENAKKQLEKNVEMAYNILDTIPEFKNDSFIRDFMSYLFGGAVS